jgi:hypothetical protein
MKTVVSFSQKFFILARKKYTVSGAKPSIVSNCSLFSSAATGFDDAAISEKSSVSEASSQISAEPEPAPRFVGVILASAVVYPFNKNSAEKAGDSGISVVKEAILDVPETPLSFVVITLAKYVVFVVRLQK